MTESGPWEFSLTPLTSKFVSCASLVSETNSLLKSLEEILLSVDEELDWIFNELCQLKLKDINWPFYNDESPCLTSTPIEPIIKILSHCPAIPVVILSLLFRVFDDVFEFFSCLKTNWFFRLNQKCISLINYIWILGITFWVARN